MVNGGKGFPGSGLGFGSVAIGRMPYCFPIKVFMIGF